MIERGLEGLLGDGISQKIEQLHDIGVVVELEMHAASLLLPRRHFAAHPEWFRMNERSERTDDYNFCVSSRDALTMVSEQTQRLARLFTPVSHKYHFWMDDQPDLRCHCDRCGSLTPADAALVTYNAVLAGLKAVDSEAKQCYLAYHDANAVPHAVWPEPGIFWSLHP